MEQQILDFANEPSAKFHQIMKLPQSGSARQYFRLFSKTDSIVGVYNEDVKENLAFFSFTKTFLNQNINVPKILKIHNNDKIYLLQDLGDVSLFSLLTTNRSENKIGNSAIDIYKKTLQQLPLIQIAGIKEIDFSVCYPRAAFDSQSMLWDLNYFKYYFLKLVNIHFDEQLLEDDFHRFINFLSEVDTQYFMFRDFQSRNIMILNNEPYFIDYQGGRKGALQYDLASLLFDGKAALPEKLRQELLEFYLNEVEKYIDIDKNIFKKYYYGFVLIRILQALGTYGFRGYYERKAHFLLSIPYAISNLKSLLSQFNFGIEIPTLMGAIQRITEINWDNEQSFDKTKLTVQITSFSYKKGIPQDFTENGGGFVFDCRALPNPGRLPEYKNLTGKDAEVIDYLEQYVEVAKFEELTSSLIKQSIDNYLERKFTNLMVNFGCTGGQHRSVYFAEKAARNLQATYPEIQITLHHKEQNI